MSKGVMFTCPRTAVEFDSHADVFGVSAVRHKANSTSDQRWIDLTQLGHVRVHVALDYLQQQQHDTHVAVLTLRAEIISYYY